MPCLSKGSCRECLRAGCYWGNLYGGGTQCVKELWDFVGEVVVIIEDFLGCPSDVQPSSFPSWLIGILVIGIVILLGVVWWFWRPLQAWWQGGPVRIQDVNVPVLRLQDLMEDGIMEEPDPRYVEDPTEVVAVPSSRTRSGRAYN